MTKFIVKGNVKYNGNLYASGQVVEVEEKDVKEFAVNGWQIIEEPKKPKTEKPKAEQKVEKPKAEQKTAKK